MAAQRRLQVRRFIAVSRQTWWGLALFAAALLVWETVGRVTELNPDFLPTPSRILLEISRRAPLLLRNARATIEEVVLGVLFALVLAVPVAQLISAFPGFRFLAAPLLRALRAAPLLAVAPLLLVWFGFGMLSKTLTVMLMAFFPAARGTLSGLLSIPKEASDLLRMMHAKKTQILLKLRVPGSLPGLFDGLRSALHLGIAGAVAAEFVSADSGLGYLMLSGISKMEVPLAFAALAFLTAVSVALHVSIVLLERFTIPWRVEIGGRSGVCCEWYALTINRESEER